MSMSVFCKTCKRLSEICLDKQDDNVYCKDCDQQITDITIFVKNNLKISKVFREPKKKNAAFEVVCSSCQKKTVPQLKDNKVFCLHCKAELKLSSHFLNALKSHKK